MDKYKIYRIDRKIEILKEYEIIAISGNVYKFFSCSDLVELGKVNIFKVAEDMIVLRTAIETITFIADRKKRNIAEIWTGDSWYCRRVWRGKWVSL